MDRTNDRVAQDRSAAEDVRAMEGIPSR